MIKNKVLDFIIKEIQWGFKQKNEQFWSERQLQIKLNVSASSAKIALITAEALGLIQGGRKGKKRIVQDFSKHIYISNYFAIEVPELRLEKVYPESYSPYDKKLLLKYASHVQTFNHMVINVFYKQQQIGRFISIIKHQQLYEHIKSHNDFIDCMRKSQILIKKIETSMSIARSHVVIKRKLISTINQEVEESFLHVKNKFFVFNMHNIFPFTMPS